MRILVVDDSGTMRRIIVKILDQIGYGDCGEAADGRDAIEQMAASRFDLVITDWNMPGMNGIDLVRTLRANPATRHVPVVMVTTNTAKPDILKALNAGVNSYVVKPFTAETMREKIDAVLAQ